MSDLATRMAKIKETSNQSPRSSSINPSPLSLFLYIYSKASHDCYINYMQGAKDLYSWLTSNGLAPLEIEENTPEFKIPHLLTSYPINELVKILSGSNDLDKQARIHRAILTVLYKDIL